jgi:DNA-binding transcriptional ArsR family regulator
MLDELAAGPRTTGEMAQRFEPLCRTAVMKHLDVLAEAELVVVRRAGRVRWNYFNPVPIDGVCRRWLSDHRRRMSGALNRLNDVVEAPLDGPVETGA